MRLLSIHAAFILLTPQVSGCIFNCRMLGRADPNYCDFPVSTVTRTVPRMFGYEQIFFSTWLNVDPQIPLDLPDTFTYHALDLSNRGITGFENGSFECYNFTPYYEPSNFVSAEQALQSAIAVELRGVILDGNSIRVFPSLRFLGLTNVSEVSAVACKIQLVASAPVDSLNSILLRYNLNSNDISTLPSNMLQTNFTAFPVAASLSFDQNNISFLDSMFFLERTPESVHLSLRNNGISRLTNSTLATFTIVNLDIDLSSNMIEFLPSGLLSHTGYGITNVTLNLDGNSVQSIPAGAFSTPQSSSSALSTVTISLVSNNISAVSSFVLQDIRFNSAGYATFTLDLSQNVLTSLPDSFLGGNMDIDFITISVARNLISSVGLIFDHYPTPTGSGGGYYWALQDSYAECGIQLNMQHNFIDSQALRNLLSSYTSSSNPLLIDLSYNQLNYLPASFLAGTGSNLTVAATYPYISLNLSNNDITSISHDAFAASPNNFPVNVISFTIDLSMNYGISLPDQPFSFAQAFVHEEFVQNMVNFTMILHNTGRSTLELAIFSAFASVANPISFALSGGVFYNAPVLTLDMSNNFIPPSELVYETSSFSDDSFQSGTPLSNISVSFNPSVELVLSLRNQNTYLDSLLPGSLKGFYGSVDLSQNAITVVPDGTFADATLNEVNLSHNLISDLNNGAFDFNLHLNTLDVSSNQLTQVHISFTTNTPLLEYFIITHNYINVLPLNGGNSKVLYPPLATDNPLRCESYYPYQTNCSCPPEKPFYVVHCNYGQCSATATGCPQTQRRTFTCDDAPGFSCISKCPKDQFLSLDTLAEEEAVCTPYTNCSTAFGGVQAYEFTAPTATSDRVCAPCSLCPAGFNTQPCTATANSVCIHQLSGGDIAAIVVSILLVFLGTLGGTSYFFLRKKKAKTDQELELSQFLLEEVEEDNERLRQAWEIPEYNLDLRQKLAHGSYGEVWKAKWGHIDVAVKLCHKCMYEGDVESEEFDREAKFMQSIRHPNLLIFYGGGIRENGTPYLVVELMDKGSMRELIGKENISWRTRRRFATEIANGMSHLHSLGSMHRDLKSDNCLVDKDLHVKVGDFGNSRLRRKSIKANKVKYSIFGSAISSKSSKNGKLSESNMLTSAVGTPLYMAPELLFGKSGSYGGEVDVYSFGIVMWELLNPGKIPWDAEISARNPMHFRSELERLLRQGDRPTILDHDGDDSETMAFIQLMKLCWDGDPSKRPTFATVHGLFHGAVD